MQTFFIVIFSITVVLFTFHFLTKKYINPYKLIMIFGPKGSGKSTFLAKVAIEHIKKGWNVYSTLTIPFTYKIDEKDVGFFHIPENSVLLIDEVGMIWDNRNFKAFKQEVRDWFKLQRHHKVKVYLFSQVFDIDKKLRDLTDEMYLIDKKLRVFSYGKRILKKPCLIEASQQGESRIDESYKFDSLLFFLFGSRKLTFIPKYVKYFDSFLVDKLADKKYEYEFRPEFKRIVKMINKNQKRNTRTRKKFVVRKRKSLIPYFIRNLFSKRQKVVDVDSVDDID